MEDCTAVINGLRLTTSALLSLGVRDQTINVCDFFQSPSVPRTKNTILTEWEKEKCRVCPDLHKLHFADKIFQSKHKEIP